MVPLAPSRLPLRGRRSIKTADPPWLEERRWMKQTSIIHRSSIINHHHSSLQAVPLYAATTNHLDIPHPGTLGSKRYSGVYSIATTVFFPMPTP